MAVRTEQCEVGHPSSSHARLPQRQFMMTFDEVDASFPVDGTEVEPACLACNESMPPFVRSECFITDAAVAFPSKVDLLQKAALGRGHPIQVEVAEILDRFPAHLPINYGSSYSQG